MLMRNLSPRIHTLGMQWFRQGDAILFDACRARLGDAR